ncbi:Rgl1 protein [Maudiozyma humilis]|uniref:Rgl1 protein n=1 Tax=Maudiozyma humilis TaxID=51915 RepID=A0AAV5S3Q8_MAUHU|nr:Rgl1 protein [Kazachstania humilis]
MTAYPVISLKPSYNSVIRGCPGVPDTLPRIECQLQIKSSNGKRVNIEKIEIILKTVETLHSTPTITSPFESGLLGGGGNGDNERHILPSRASSTRSGFIGDHGSIPSLSDNSGSSLLSKAKRKKNKFELVTTHYRKIINLKSNQKKGMIGLDLPLTIALPDNIKETNYNEKFGNCITCLECNVQYDSKHVKTFSHMINVDRFTNLPSKELFPRVSKKMRSPDKRFIIHYRVDNPCVTTDDVLKVSVDIKPDPSSDAFEMQNKGLLFNKKTKLKHVVFQIKEVLQVNDTTGAVATSSHHHHPHLPHNIDSRENVLCTFTQDMNKVISLNPIHIDHNLRVFTKDKFFRNYEITSQEPEFLYKLPKNVADPTKQGDIKTLLLQNKDNNIPFQYHNSITTHGAFFSVLHYLTIKFKMNNGKDIEISQNITLSKWPKTQVKYIESIMDSERQTAVNARNFYDNYGGITNKRIPEANDSQRRASFTDQSSYNSQYILEYPILPPSIYYYDEPTLKKYEIQYHRSGKKLSRIPVIE